jgi:hypothetical protein
MADPEKQLDGPSHDESINGAPVDKSNIEAERFQLLRELGDPDEGKSDEERRAIVSAS